MDGAGDSRRLISAIPFDDAPLPYMFLGHTQIKLDGFAHQPALAPSGNSSSGRWTTTRSRTSALGQSRGCWAHGPSLDFFEVRIRSRKTLTCSARKLRPSGGKPSCRELVEPQFELRRTHSCKSCASDLAGAFCLFQTPQASDYAFGDADVRIGDVKPVISMSSRHSLVSSPGVGSPSRFKSNVLNTLQRPYCGGKLAPAGCSVTPKTRPVPLKM
jgi:hypothetical protein